MIWSPPYLHCRLYRRKGGGLELSEEAVVEEKRKYFQLLKKLIKERKENEQTADEKIEDLRRDIRNDWIEWTKTSEGLQRTRSLKIS